MLHPVSNVVHLRQVHSGFQALEREGLVRVRADLRCAGPLARRPAAALDFRAFCMAAQVRDGPVIVYDVHDGWFIDDDLLARCDVYFKRSYDPARHGGEVKIRPLGLNLVCDDTVGSLSSLRRTLRFDRGRARLRALLEALPFSPVFTPCGNDLRGLPASGSEPRVLFITRVWPLSGFHAQDADTTARREALNLMRAECVRALRRAFGPRFQGGLMPDAYSRATFPDLVVEDPGATRRDRYFEAVRASEVCVTTRGLDDSTGWKFAEYLAMGRAVVSERLAYASPGLEEGVHHLAYDHPDGCVEAVARLLQDRAARQTMMEHAARYYDARVRPASLVRASLAQALAHHGGGTLSGSPT